MRLSPQEIAATRERWERRHQLSALIGRRVPLKQHGGAAVGLCPFHSERTPSFNVVDDKGFYHCFGCGAHGDVIDWLVEVEGKSFTEAMTELNGGITLSDRYIEVAQIDRKRQDDAARARKRQLARELWASAAPIAGTPGEGYFRARGIMIPLPPSLRFLAECPHGPTSHGRRLPAVICAVQGADRAIIAVHRIYLDPASCHRGTPEKTRREPAKALLGSPMGGAIRLAPAGERLGVCEGVETGLAVMQGVPELPVWAAISAGQLCKIELPATAIVPVILADRDRVCWHQGPLYGTRPGEHFAALAAARFKEQGRRPLIARPPTNEADFGDLATDWSAEIGAGRGARLGDAIEGRAA